LGDEYALLVEETEGEVESLLWQSSPLQYGLGEDEDGVGGKGLKEKETYPSSRRTLPQARQQSSNMGRGRGEKKGGGM
jgi:hypothetical protein